MYQSTEPCPNCGAQNLRGAWVCPHCGTTLVVYCPQCRAGNASGSQFCHSCGSQLSSAVQAPQQQPYAQPAYPGQQAPDTQQYYQQPPQSAYGDQQYYQQYQEPYAPYEGYQQPYGASMLGSFKVRLTEIVRNTNPILLSSLVVLVVGLAVFLVLAFQLGWIKTGAPAKIAAGPKDTTLPIISLLQVKEGKSPNSAIIYWVTDKYTSTQVEYGVWPYPNTTTQIENDPQTGINEGALIHEVNLTNLLPRTAYVYRAVSIDKDGNKAVTPDSRFDTSVGSSGGSQSGSTNQPTTTTQYENAE